jgi:hypothetical protein
MVTLLGTFDVFLSIFQVLSAPVLLYFQVSHGLGVPFKYKGKDK